MLRQSRGSSLIFVLLLLAMLLILGLGLATRAYLGYATGVSEADYSLAQSLAQSGLEDFRTKASLDQDFPPKFSDRDVPIVYGEEVREASGRLLGRYQVQVLTERAAAPHFVYQVKATGFSNRTKFVVTGYLENKPGLRWLGFETEDRDWY